MINYFLMMLNMATAFWVNNSFLYNFILCFYNFFHIFLFLLYFYYFKVISQSNDRNKLKIAIVRGILHYN